MALPKNQETQFLWFGFEGSKWVTARERKPTQTQCFLTVKYQIYQSYQNVWHLGHSETGKKKKKESRKQLLSGLETKGRTIYGERKQRRKGQQWARLQSCFMSLLFAFSSSRSDWVKAKHHEPGESEGVASSTFICVSAHLHFQPSGVLLQSDLQEFHRLC